MSTPTGGGYDVVVSSLIAGAGNLDGDAEDLADAGADAARAAHDAAVACCGGPLASALARLGQELQARTDLMTSATDEAATTLAGNAWRYESDDDGAAAGLGG